MSPLTNILSRYHHFWGVSVFSELFFYSVICRIWHKNVFAFVFKKSGTVILVHFNACKQASGTTKYPQFGAKMAKT